MMSVHDLGMKLQTPQPPGFVSQRRDDPAGACQDLESRWRSFNSIAMIHPHLKLIRQAGKKSVRVQQINHSLAELALVSRHHGATQAPGNKLQAVTDAESRNSKLEEFRG